MLNVIILYVILMIVIILNVIVLIVIILNVIVLIVIFPHVHVPSVLLVNFIMLFMGKIRPDVMRNVSGNHLDKNSTDHGT
jgi:hypothetical protein